MASDVGETPCKKRKPNWTGDECLYLTKLVEENKGILRSKFGAGMTTQKKRETWRKIADAVNASSAVSRSVEEVKKKWHNLHMKGRSELSDHRKQLTMTGGGPSQCSQISPIAEAVGNVIGMDNVSICGIEGAVDTSLMMLLDSNTSDSSAISRSSDILLTGNPSTLETHPEDNLRKEKLELEIKNLKLQNKLLEMKIKKLSES